MGERPDVSVVVVTYESAPVIGRCLRSVRDRCGEVEVEVVVVDNASTDASIPIARRVVPTASVIRMPSNRGYASAINAGLDACVGRDVLVLNPDVVVGRDMLDRLRRAATGGVGITVPRLLDVDGSVARSIRREPTVGRAWAEALLGGGLANRLGAGEIVTTPSAYEAVHPVDWASGAVMLLTRACLDRVGPFDESFFLYSEETDYMLRARDAGFASAYVPDAVAVHGGGELSTSAALWSRRTVNRVRLQRRRHGRLSTAAFLGASLAGEGVRAVAGRSTNRRAFADLCRVGPRIVAGPSPPVVAARQAPVIDLSRPAAAASTAVTGPAGARSGSAGPAGGGHHVPR